jgi:enterochelin esterase family protein
MITTEPIRSPQLNRLQHELESGNKEPLKLFWKRIKEQGTPLVEEFESDSQDRIVTFLWQTSGGTKSVALVSQMTKPTTCPMTRLLDTDLWYITLQLPANLRATYWFLPSDLPASAKGAFDATRADYRSDPFNPKVFAFFDDKEDPTGLKMTHSVLELPNAAPQPWIEPQGYVSKGKVQLHQLQSRILGNERRVWVYSPAKYTAGLGQPYPLLVLFDGWAYARLIPTFTILDNLVAARVIPPVVVMLLDSLDAETRSRELVFYKPFNDFLVTEFLPWALTQYAISTDPSQRIIGGSGTGGLAAAYAALEHPDVFGSVLSQSGAFTLLPKGEPESSWLARQFFEREKLPLKFYLSVGTLEANNFRELRGRPSTLAENRRMYEALRAKHYKVHYTEFSGGHDYINWQGMLAEGLMALLG